MIISRIVNTVRYYLIAFNPKVSKIEKTKNKLLHNIREYLVLFNATNNEKSFASRRRLENHGMWIYGKINDIIDEINKL